MVRARGPRVERRKMMRRKGGRWRTPVLSCTYINASDLVKEPVNAISSPFILPVMYKNPSYSKFKVK